MRHVTMLAVLTLFPAALASAEGLQIKGVTPGVTTRTEIQERYPSASCPDFCTVISNIARQERCGTIREFSERNRCDDSIENELQFGPAWAIRYDFHFAGEVVSSAHVVFTENWFPQVVAALTGKYGKPTRTASAAVQNAMGAKFPNKIVTWERGGLTLVAEQRSGEVQRSMVTVMSPRLVRSVARDVEAAAKASAGHL